MKHFFLRFASCALVGLGVFASCQQIHDVEDPLESVAQQMTIVASLDGTRTANSGNSTVWVTNDEISVIHGASTGDPAYAASKFTYSGDNEFTGRVKNLADVNDWFMVYPYREDNVNAEEVHVTVGPQTQNGNDNTAHLAGENFPLYGREFNVSKSDGITIFMNNILTRLNLRVDNTTSSPIVVKSITFTGPVKFFGDFTGDLKQSPVVWTADQNASDEAVLTVANGAQLATNATATFYLGTMPFTVAPGGQAKAKIVAVHPSAPNTEIAFYHVFNFADGASFSAGKFNTFNLHFDEIHQTDPGDPSNPDEPTQLTPRNLEFAETELVWTLGQGYETGSVYDLPALSGVTEGVTYSSTNEDVAVIVNGNKVRLVADGMTTIKASALATETYEAGEASLSLQVLPRQTEPSTTTTYTKATSLTVGGTYVVVDVADQRLFTAATNGSYVNVTPSNGVISDPNNSYAGYEFTVTKSGDKYCLMHDGQYLVNDYTMNSSTGIVYESTKPEDRYLYDYSVHDNGVFEFSTDQRGSGNTGEVLYYKTSNSVFKVGGSGVGVGVHLYLKTAEGTTQQTQTISFAQSTLNWTMGTDCVQGGSYDMPALNGVKTTVNYSSDNEGVAAVSGGQIVVNGVGTAHITASAVETAAWTGSTATLTVTISEASASTTTTYTKATSLTVGGTYVVMDVADQRLFTAATNGSYVSIRPTNGVISDPDNSYAGYEFTVTKSGDKYCLMHDGQYLVNDYTMNSSTGIVYESTKPEDRYLYDYSVHDNGVFEFSTDQRGSGNTGEVLYYKTSNSVFKVGGSGVGVGVHLYLKTSQGTPQQSQTISFTSPNPVWVIGQGYAIGSRYAIPAVTGNHTPLSYSIEPSSVASIVNGQIQINGVGTATLTAEAAETDQYSGASATTTITIRNASEPTTSAYVKVTAEPDNWAGTYLFVDESSSKAFAAFSNVTGYAVNVTINSDGTITSNGTVDTYALTVTDAGRQHGNSNVSNQRAYTLQNTDGKYIYVSQSSIQIQDSNVGGSGNYTYYAAFKYFNDSSNRGVQVLSANNSGSTVYYLGYGNNAFSYEGSSSPSSANQARRVQLYKLSGDVTPTPGPGPDDPTPTTGERTYTYFAPNNLEEGTYVIAGSESNELSVALFPTVSTGSWNSQVTGQVNNGQFVPHKVVGTNNSASSFTTEDADVINSEVELTQSGNGWKIQVKSTGKYLVVPTQEYRINYVDASSSATAFSVSSGTSGATVQSGSYYFYHSGSAGGFTFRTNSTGNTRFYKLTAGGGDPAKQNQNLSFAESTQTYALEQSQLPRTITRQTVQNSHGTVTYESNNTNVATVSGSNVTLVGYGEARITARASGDDNWNAASQYYTITVRRVSQEGVFNLENDEKSRDTYAQGNVRLYFDLAYANYTESNHSSSNGNSSLTYVNDYANRGSRTQRFDWPSPATVTWTSSQTGTLSVYYDASYTNEEIMAVPVISSNSAEIYNLIPNKHYYWVLKNGNTTVASGEFDTEGRRRMIAIGEKTNYGQNYANNCRDLGGQVTTGNKTIRYSKIFRGSNMDQTTTDQKSYIINKMKIGLDVDLRGSGEQNNVFGSSPYNFANIPAGTYSTYRGHTQETYSGGSDLTNRSKMGPTLMRIFNAVHNGVNVYIHCMVGADRTGGTCLLLESLLGVPPERCDIDFELTSFSTVGTRARNGYSPEQYYTVYNAINNTSGENWQDKAINYCVNSLGVDRGMITQFQNDMLE